MKMTNSPEPVSEQTEPPRNGEVGTQCFLPGSTHDSSHFSPLPSHGPRSSVELHIEELVLQGFDPAHRYTIGDAVECELARLITEQGEPMAITHDVAIAHLNGGTINMKPGSNGEAAGIQLARIVYGGLGR